METVKKGEEKVFQLLEVAKTTMRRPLGPAVVRLVPRIVLDAARETHSWWTRERVNRVAEICLPNRHMDALIIDTLCHLTCASLTEDLFGVVQRDIPKIIEAILSFLTAIEEYQTEINALYTPPSSDDIKQLSKQELAERLRLGVEVAMAGEVLSEVGDALKDGIMTIARTFGEKLTAFKFPPRTARKLQGFVDYV